MSEVKHDIQGAVCFLCHSHRATPPRGTLCCSSSPLPGVEGWCQVCQLNVLGRVEMCKVASLEDTSRCVWRGPYGLLAQPLLLCHAEYMGLHVHVSKHRYKGGGVCAVSCTHLHTVHMHPSPMPFLILSSKNGSSRAVCKGRTEITGEQGRTVPVGFDSKQYMGRGEQDRVQ